MKPTIQPLKGTRDFYPEEMAVRNWLYQKARQVSESFGYQEYDAPFLESINLYAAKSGDELVKEQSFVFPDRGGDLIALRPELTLSLARMVAQRQRQLVYPLRWWSWGPMWRYERPQKGRYREFFQWNIDLIGVDSPQADAEMVAICAAFLRACGLSPDQVSVLFNSRELVDAELHALEIPFEKKTDVFHLIDRRDKLSPSAWEAYAFEIGMNSRQLDGLQALLANEDLWKNSPVLVEFQEAVAALGASEYVRYAPHVIRGLDYYTGVVFETWDKDGEFRAVLGGGRYDNLVADVGGEPLPATGFAMGDAVVTLVLKKFGCLPENLGATPAQVLVTLFDESSAPAALGFAAQLRQAGVKVTCHPELVKLAKQFKYAERISVPLVAVIGPDELANQTVTLKDLRSGKQVTLPRTEVAKKIQGLLLTR
jgi:histidyl-tRNA synthetase